MFKKILIANRGEIAFRVARTCREMNIPSLALYEMPDQGSLHVRLADECVPLDVPGGFLNGAALIQIAQARGADAVHPGYGFLAEDANFARGCAEAGLTFIGPRAQTLEAVSDKLAVLEQARAAGFPTPAHSPRAFSAGEDDALLAAAQQLGYPLIIKTRRGGRGRGAHLVFAPELLPAAITTARREAHLLFGDDALYLEQAITPAHMLGVQLLADTQGNVLTLGEHEGSLLHGAQKLVQEAPAPGLSSEQRAGLSRMAFDLAKLFGYDSVGTVEFIQDRQGNLYFTEFKPRIQTEHALTELLTGVDLVREQILIAAGEPLQLGPADVAPRGWAMAARIYAQDPWNRWMPSPGLVRRARMPGGPGVRIDTYIYSGCPVPAEYDPLVANISAWAVDRAGALARLARALGELKIIGTSTNLPVLQRLVRQPELVAGTYDTSLRLDLPQALPTPEMQRDLAAAEAVYYDRSRQAFRPSASPRLSGNWQRPGEWSKHS